MIDNRSNSTARVLKTVAIASTFAAVGFIAMAPSANARGFVEIGVGVPIFAPPVYYYPPPVVYAAPPPVVYAPVAAAPVAAPVAAPPPAYANADCHQYSTTQNIGGTPQQVVGTACRQPDGSWRIVQ
jgi:hypothetical protein